MNIFSKAIAEIYVDQVRHRIDERTVAIFPPDTVLRVGDFGSFEDGRFLRKGTLKSRGFYFEPADPYPDGDNHSKGTGDTVIAIQSDEAAAFEYATAGKVNIGATGLVKSVIGPQLARAVVSFTENKALVASFADGIQREPVDIDRFAEQLLQMWKGGDLAPNRLVVVGVRRSRGGTVLVATEGGSSVEVLVDPTQLVGSINVGSLQAGAKFGAEQKSVWKMATAKELTVSVMLLGYAGGKARDVFGFEAQFDPINARVMSLSNDHVLSILRE
jgi:hypothetical protein